MLTKNTANGESNVKILSLGSDTLKYFKNFVFSLVFTICQLSMYHFMCTFVYSCSPELKEDIIEADKV